MRALAVERVAATRATSMLVPPATAPIRRARFAYAERRQRRRQQTATNNMSHGVFGVPMRSRLIVAVRRATARRQIVKIDDDAALVSGQRSALSAIRRPEGVCAHTINCMEMLAASQCRRRRRRQRVPRNFQVIKPFIFRFKQVPCIDARDAHSHTQYETYHLKATQRQARDFIAEHGGQIHSPICAHMGAHTNTNTHTHRRVHAYLAAVHNRRSSTREIA